MLGLVPGMTFVQWVTGRLAAQGIRNVVRAGRALFRSPPQDEEAAIGDGSRSRSDSYGGPPPAKSAGSNIHRTGFTIAPS